MEAKDTNSVNSINFEAGFDEQPEDEEIEGVNSRCSSIRMDQVYKMKLSLDMNSSARSLKIDVNAQDTSLLNAQNNQDVSYKLSENILGKKRLDGNLNFHTK